MERYQRGCVLEASNAFHVSYYVNEIVKGEPEARATFAAPLCASVGRITTPATAQRPRRLQLAEDHMRTINTAGASTTEDISVVDFWEEIPAHSVRHRLYTHDPAESDFYRHPKLSWGHRTRTDMIVGKENCRGFMVAAAALVVLLTVLLFFAWSRKRDNPKPEPPLHTATLGSKNSDVA